MDDLNVKYIQEYLSQLPQGNITYKKINGKAYPYYQWTEYGKQRSRIVKPEEFDKLKEKIKQRKALEKKLKEARACSSHGYSPPGPGSHGSRILRK